jgi:hypothetical protein
MRIDFPWDDFNSLIRFKIFALYISLPEKFSCDGGIWKFLLHVDLKCLLGVFLVLRDILFGIDGFKFLKAG